ncbi:MAG: RNA polymerase sigma factor RpoD/SigA [Spirochaetales bacterium]|nr:RNA polymerase sigma factor RpoD/SigA [Spirochaetales bacterium]MBP7263381.1 RNA polymerase sigma factor RpoD/SigA [Spirochaetia bacterium]
MPSRTQNAMTEDSLKMYYERVKLIPLLSAEEERELSMRIQMGEDAARSRLIEANLRLVIKIARSFSNFDIPLVDLIQEGNMGLIKAAERFDYRKNVRFSTYASWWIKQAVTRSLVNSRRAIRLPHRKEELIRRIHKIYGDLSQSLSREPTHAELAKELGISAQAVREALELSSAIVPLETEHDEEDCGSVIDVFEDLTYSPDIQFEREQDRTRTLALLEELMDRERKVLMYRFEFYGTGRSTLKTIGQTMGLSAETVRQIEKRALRKLRERNTELYEYA